MEFTNRLLQQLQTFWTNLSRRQRVSLVAAVTLLLSGLMGLVFWANQVDYQPLFTNLKPEQAPAIVEALKQRKEPYRLTNGGSTIEVPSEHVLELRMALATQGALKDGVVGFELFDNAGIGVTNFVEKLNYQRALQGELMRTIDEIEQVEASRVHLVLPRESLFVSDQKPATASVVLKIKAGQHLSKEQVQGIVNLVASSIEGLRPENISVVDTDGRMLAAPHDNSIASMPGTMLEYQETLERKLEDRVQSFLEKVVGPGKVIAKVQAQLELKSVETTAESYSPDSKVPRSEQARDEVRRNVAPTAQGVPGTGSNLPGNAPSTTTTGTLPEIEKKESTTNYEIDKTVSRTVQAPGSLKRLTVAVLIDGTYKAGKAADPKATTASKLEYVARNEDEMKLFDKIVRNAVGYSEDRSDEVSVSNMQFHQLGDDVVEKTQGLPWEKPTRYGMVLVGMVLVFFLIRPLLKSVAEDVRPGLEDGEGGAAGLLGAGAEAGALPGAAQLKMLTAGSQEKQRREEMINLARSDIDNTVQTVRDWLR